MNYLVSSTIHHYLWVNLENRYIKSHCQFVLDFLSLESFTDFAKCNIIDALEISYIFPGNFAKYL